MTKVPRLVNYSTKYELVVTNDRDIYLVAYCLRANRRMLINAIQARGPELLAVLALSEDARFEFTNTSSVTARLGEGWTVTFTGRTQKDAICTQSEHRSIVAVAIERKAR